MDIRCFPILFSLNLFLMTAHAALPPQIYWERMLPNTPMPKPIIELLKHGGFLSRKITNNDQKAHVVEWGKSLDNQLEDEFRATLYLPKKDLFQEENNFPFYGIKKSEYKKDPLQEEKAFTFYDIKKNERIQKTRLKDDFPLFYTHGIKKNELVQDTRSENFPLFYSHGIMKNEPTQKTRLKDDFPLFYSYGTKKSELSQNPYGIKKNKKTHLEDDFPLFYTHDIKHKTLSRNVDIITSAYHEAPHQLHNRASGLIPKMWPVSDDHQLHDHHLFFMEDGLRPGSKFDVCFNKREHTTPLLPRQVAQRIPFTSEKVKEILDIFSVEPESEIAEDVGKAIWYCEVPASNGEQKHCATSLESMVDFIISMLGNNVHAKFTEVERETKSRKFTVKDGVNKLADENIIVCHPMNYPLHMVFYCHHLLNTTAHFVPLEGEDGARVKAVAICHKDTSQWYPNHWAFQVLKIKPGDAPVCHFLSQGNLMFVQ